MAWQHFFKYLIDEMTNRFVSFKFLFSNYQCLQKGYSIVFSKTDDKYLIKKVN